MAKLEKRKILIFINLNKNNLDLMFITKTATTLLKNASNL